MFDAGTYRLFKIQSLLMHGPTDFFSTRVELRM